jgi:hypothetical protein
LTIAIDEEYFEWLYRSIAGSARNPDRSHLLLCEQLHKKEFLWFIPNDDNRVADGIDLRHEFANLRGITEPDKSWLEPACSIFEMLIALSRRASFQAEGSHDEWFWRFIENLELRKCSDSYYMDNSDAWNEVNDALDRLNERTYRRNGQGGLFPLRSSHRDQRKIEIWYQLAAYLLEDDRFEVGPAM